MTDACPDWDEIPAPVARPRRRHVAGALVGPALLALVGVAVAVSGHRRRAAVVIALAVVVAVALMASPRFRALVERGAAAVGRGASVVLGFLTLVPAYYLVVVPLGLVLRLVGARPLDVGRSRGRAGAGSYWWSRAAGPDPKPARMYTVERGWSPLGFSRRQRSRLVLSTVMATLLVQGAIAGGGYLVVQRRANPAPPAAGGVSTIGASKSAAMRGYDWAPTAFKETSALTKGIVYTPFTGSSMRDYAGTYVNVKNRVRRSYESPLAAGAEPIDVWFFGGSTMFGFDLQRDEHTIPSEIVRLAEQEGIPVRARNYGSPGFVNFQETALLTLLVTGGERPDLVVFYDGTNDVALGALNAVSGMNAMGEPAELGALQQRQALAAGGSVRGATDAPAAGLGLRPQTRPITAKGIVDDVVAVYGQGRELARTLGARHDFPVMHFWQPDLYSKRALDPGERELFPTLKLDDVRYALYGKLNAWVRASLPPEVIDISKAMDRLDGPIYSDNVHHNEAGARAVAEEMFRSLRPTLEQLNGRG